MGRGGGRIAVGLLVVPAVVAGLAGCGNAKGQPMSAAAAAAKAASVERATAAKLKSALLTRVNGVAPAAPASSGKYASLTQATTDGQASGDVQVTPKACAESMREGFDPTALAGAPAAAVTFRVDANDVSEVLISSSGKTALAALVPRVPAGCARYQEKAGGKTYTYTGSEQAVTGVGKQAKVLNVRATGTSLDDQWSLVYRGAGFIGAVTVVGPDASDKAVQELGKQAYAFAAKTLS